MKIDLKVMPNQGYGIYVGNSIDELIDFTDNMFELFKAECNDITAEEMDIMINQGKEIVKILSAIQPRVNKYEVIIDIRVVCDSFNPSKGIIIQNKILDLIQAIESAYSFYNALFCDSPKDFPDYTLAYQDVHRVLNDILDQVSDIERIKTICYN